MISASETPREAARRLTKPYTDRGYELFAMHVYRDKTGNTLFHRLRLEHPDGDAAPYGRKVIRPMRLNGHGFELKEPDFAPGKKPLYNLDRIAADPLAKVWIVEGEKDADALTELGAIATTSGGASSANDADWSVLAGRDCCIWPDNDDPGRAYAGDVGNILAGLGCRLSCIDIDKLELSPKGDAWDWLQSHENATLGDLQALPVLAYQPTTQHPIAADSDGPRIELIRGDSIRPEAVDWIWDGFLAAGKMHVLAGAPGTGKTTIALALAATVTTGGRWPDGSGCDVGDVLIWSGEDSPADTLAPRLIASGADMRRVHFVGPAVTTLDRRPFDPATDFPALIHEAAKLPALRLMLVDPIVSAVAGDSHKNAETRRALAPLVEFAERAKCSLIGISHFTKGTKGSDPVERITGSLAFAAVARIVLVTAKLNEDDEDARVVVRAKSNIGPDGGGFRYELHQVELGQDFPGLSASRVEWGKLIEGEAREILATAEQVAEEGGGSNAKEFLRYMLASGPALAAQVFRDGEAHGYSKRQLQRARAALGATIDKLGMRGGWEWSLPKVPRSLEDTEDTGRNSLAPSAPSAASSSLHPSVEEF